MEQVFTRGTLFFLLSVARNVNAIVNGGNAEVIRIPNNTCNEVTETLVLTQFPNLKELHVGSGSLKNVKHLILNGLESLEKVEIKANCFSDTDSGSLEISKCKRLTEVKVGNGCFSTCRRTVFYGSVSFSL